MVTANAKWCMGQKLKLNVKKQDYDNQGQEPEWEN